MLNKATLFSRKYLSSLKVFTTLVSNIKSKWLKTAGEREHCCTSKCFPAQIKWLRSNETCLDETTVSANHSQSKGWTDDSLFYEQSLWIRRETDHLSCRNGKQHCMQCSPFQTEEGSYHKEMNEVTFARSSRIR